MSEGEKLEAIGHAMMLAWGRIKKAQARMWGDWMTIGEGLLEGRRWAMQQAGTNKPEGKGYVMAYAEWLKRFRVDDMDKSDRAKLLQLMEERPSVEDWRAGLSNYDRRNLNNPTIAWRKWTAATRVKKPKPRSAGVSATEHGRAQHTVEEQQARIEELEEELTAARESEPVAGGVPVGELIHKLGPIIRELKVQGKKTQVTMSVVVVARLAEYLHRHLNEWAGGREVELPKHKVESILPRELRKGMEAETAALAEEEAAPPANGALVWKDQGDDAATEEDRIFEAQAGAGIYTVSPAMNWPSMKFAGYRVAHVANPTAKKLADRGRRNIATVKTVEKAKAAAQEDHDAGRDRN